MFPKGYLYDTQIIATLLSADGENDPDLLCINGASAALAVSDIPFGGPIGAVRVGMINGEFVVNPTHAERQFSDLDLVFAGTLDEIIMIEGEAMELPEEKFIEALAFAQTHVKALVTVIKDLAKAAGKEKRQVTLFSVRPEIQEIAYQVAGDRIEAAIYNPTKTARGKAVGALKDEVKAGDPRQVSRRRVLRDFAGVRVHPEKSLPRLHPRQAKARGRPRVHGNPPAQRGGRPPAPRARLGSVPAR